MYQIGETVRLTANIPVETATPSSCKAFMRTGELVRIVKQGTNAHFYTIADADGNTAFCSRWNFQADESLPMFDEFRPETTGCLF